MAGLSFTSSLSSSLVRWGLSASTAARRERALLVSASVAGRLRTRKKTSLMSLESSFSVSTSLAMALVGSLMAVEMVGPLSSARTEPRRISLLRSHSQALWRAGRPRVASRPLPTSVAASASWVARWPGLAPGICGVLPVTRKTARKSAPTGDGMGIIDLVVLVPFGWTNGELIGARLADKLHQVLRVEAIADEFVGQVFEQGGIAVLVAGPNIVERFDDSSAGKIAPEAIGVAGGEKAVVGRANPGRQLLTTRGVFLRLRFGRKRKGGRRHLARAVVFHFPFFGIADDFVERLGAFDRGAADFFAFAGRIFLQGNLGKISRKVVILVLSPALERMVVALIAVEASGQEQVRRIFHRLRGSADDLPITGRRVLAG